MLGSDALPSSAGNGHCSAGMAEDRGAEVKADDGAEPEIQLRSKAHKTAVHQKRLKQEMEAMSLNHMTYRSGAR